ncbi:MAG: hypothetical protein JXB10_11435 [Pirellulales bacterium]|nr:hypothetical protein [Pirellulales bacterium]
MSPPGKKKSSTSDRQRLRTWEALSRGGTLFRILFLGAFFIALYAGWKILAPQLIREERYVLSPEDFQLPSPPPWIQTNLREEVFRELSRDHRPSLLDRDLADRVAAAFQRQPWIAEVHKVRPLPSGRVEVAVTYRRPVLMVEVAGGVLPVDVQGVRLPTGGFTPLEAAKYPHLSGVDRPPPSVAGGRWMDGRVLGGAGIAAALLPVWEKYQLQRIVPLPEQSSPGGNAPANGEDSFVILTRGGKRIFWGAAGLEPDRKVEKLRALTDEYGSLDLPNAPKEFDLRQP